MAFIRAACSRRPGFWPGVSKGGRHGRDDQQGPLDDWAAGQDAGSRLDGSRAGQAGPGARQSGRLVLTPGSGTTGRPAVPRLLLRPENFPVAPLDGGWWPRSDDPAAELPGLIAALDERCGRITRVMLGTVGWGAGRPRRVYVGNPAGSRVVKVGWFATMPAGLLTAISARGLRADLVTIPSGASEQAASAALRQAARAGNREHAPELLAAIAAAAGQAADAAPGEAAPGAPLRAREPEGGQLASSRLR
jgi:Family of unknown function (DUF5994)